MALFHSPPPPSGSPSSQDAERPRAPAAPPRRRVLNVGSGATNARRLHPAFAADAWEEVRFDISPDVKPDVVGSITAMTAAFPPQSFDAVWASHILEHLYAHDVPVALAQARTILRPDGFAIFTCPDLEAVASLILEHGMDHVAYQSPAGPITPLDIMFGHSPSLQRGEIYMAHNTGFTCESLGKRLTEAGFCEALVKRERIDLWALALMDKADKAAIQQMLDSAGLDMFDGDEGLP
jgi:predicted SAM-dependent methyltransferase